MFEHASRERLGTARDLAEALEEWIRSGRLEPGERLPTVREAASDLGLAVNTVAAAYRRLGERGVVESRGRRGTFVASRPAFAPDPPIPSGVVDLASGNPDPALLPDLDPVVSGGHGQVLYGADPVLPELEAAVRRWTPSVEGDLAIVGGALDGVERVLAATLRPGDRVGLEAPGWPAFPALVQALRLQPVPIPVDDRGPLPAALAEAISSIDALVVTTRVQNPTGAAVDGGRADELRAVLSRAPDVLVVEDDHAGWISGVDLCPVGPGRSRWALVQSMSKSLGPDLRTAAVFGDGTTIGRLRERQAAGAGWVSHLLQRTVARLLDDPGTPVLLDRATETYRRRRVALLDALAAAGVAATGRTGLNVWAWVEDERAVVDSLLEAGYAARAGERWRMGTPPAVRITTSRLPPEEAPGVAAAVAGARGGRRTALRSV